MKIFLKKIIRFSFLLYLAFSCQKDLKIENLPSAKSDYLVSLNAAKSIAENILLNDNIVYKSIQSRNPNFQTNLKQVDTIKVVLDKNNISALYIINYVDGGFLILSGDKREAPILAFSENNYFDLNYEVQSTGINDVLLLYKQNIERIRNENNTQTIEIAYLWDELNQSFDSNINPLNDPPGGGGCTESLVTHGPFIQTTWSQGCGYNDYLPTLACGECQKAWTGCTLTATAQVMRFCEEPGFYS